MQASRDKINELQMIISKMPIEACCVTALPEFGVRWRDIAKAVRNARLPMTPNSVAKILCRHVVNTLPSEEVSEIVARLRLKLEATRKRTWHLIKLSEQISDEPVNVLTRVLPSRVLQAVRSIKRQSNMQPEVHTVKLGDLIYISIQMVSATACGSVLYVAAVPREPVALASTVKGSLLGACVRGLGYNTFEDASLHGQDIYSLLRIYNTNHNEQPDFFTDEPSCSIVPSITRNGIDYTSRGQIEKCAEGVLGAAPHLNKLTVTAERDFFDPDILKKKMKVTFQLESEDIAQTLLSWAKKGAILPNSELFQIFHKIKSNKIHIEDE
ncbi:unnamed protein product, partial [Brenthis ino]